MRHISLGLLLLLIGTLFGCTDQRRLRKGKPLKPRSASFLENRLDKSEVQFDWVGMKLEVDVEINGDKKGFKSTVRIKRDSLIWISITPLLGVEAAKVIFTPDSVKYISKIPGDKHYFIGDIESLQEKFDAAINFYMIQDLLVGNAVGKDPRDGFKSKVDDRQYVLISQFTRKLKRLTGIDEKEVNPDDSVTVELEDKRLERVLRKADDDDLIFRRYWLSGETYKLERTQIDDLQKGRSIEIEHSDFDDYDGQFVPETTRLKMSSDQGVSNVEIEINRLKFNKPYETPFLIPEDYERRYY